MTSQLWPSVMLLMVSVLFSGHDVAIDSAHQRSPQPPSHHPVLRTRQNQYRLDDLESSTLMTVGHSTSQVQVMPQLHEGDPNPTPADAVSAWKTTSAKTKSGHTRDNEEYQSGIATSS